MFSLKIVAPPSPKRLVESLLAEYCSSRTIAKPRYILNRLDSFRFDLTVYKPDSDRWMTWLNNTEIDRVRFFEALDLLYTSGNYGYMGRNEEAYIYDPIHFKNRPKLVELEDVSEDESEY